MPKKKSGSNVAKSVVAEGKRHRKNLKKKRALAEAAAKKKVKASARAKRFKGEAEAKERWLASQSSAKHAPSTRARIAKDAEGFRTVQGYSERDASRGRWDEKESRASEKGSRQQLKASAKTESAARTGESMKAHAKKKKPAKLRPGTSNPW